MKTFNDYLKNKNSITILEGTAMDSMKEINKLIDKAIKEKDKKTLDMMIKEIDKILKTF